MTTKCVKLKLGLAEVVIEGDQESLHDEALRLLDRMVDMIPAQPDGVSPAVVLDATPSVQSVLEAPNVGASDFDFSVDMIATHRGCSSATDVAESACVHLHFVGKKSEFDRKEILATMKEATSFYKDTMRGNLTVILNSLVKGGTLLSRSSGKYALSNSARTAAETSLAQIG